jgi:hypothetical protein
MFGRYSTGMHGDRLNRRNLRQLRPSRQRRASCKECGLLAPPPVGEIVRNNDQISRIATTVGCAGKPRENDLVKQQDAGTVDSQVARETVRQYRISCSMTAVLTTAGSA